MKKVKPSVMEKYDLEYRDLSSLLSFFGPFSLFGFRHKDQGPWFFFENSPSTELSTERLMEDFKLVVLEKYQFENRDLKLKITFSAISAGQYWYPKKIQ